MSQRVQISVVIPAYDAGAFIDDALASVSEQIRRPVEVIVVDDGSRDGTAIRAEAWAARLAPSRLIVLRTPHGGPCVARNRGILASGGDVLAFLDADDVYEPNHLAVLAPGFDIDPALSIAFGDMVRWGGPRDGELLLAPIREDLLRSSRHSAVEGLQLVNADVRAIYLRQTCIVPSSWLVARRVFAEAGLFDPMLGYGEDLDFLCRALPTGGAAWCNLPTGKKRDHGANLTAKANAAVTDPQVLYTFARIRRFTRGLTAAELDSVNAELDVAAYEVQYAASSVGLAAYFRSRRKIRELTGRSAPFVPKQLLRSIVPRWLLQRRNQRHQTHG